MWRHWTESDARDSCCTGHMQAAAAAALRPWTTPRRRYGRYEERNERPLPTSRGSRQTYRNRHTNFTVAQVVRRTHRLDDTHAPRPCAIDLTTVILCRIVFTWNILVVTDRGRWRRVAADAVTHGSPDSVRVCVTSAVSARCVSSPLSVFFSHYLRKEILLLLLF